MSVPFVRPKPSHLLAVVLVSLVPAAPAVALDAAALGPRLDAAARSAGPFSGAYAREVGTGRELVAVRPDEQRIPASVEKLFVTATALLRFGPDAQLQTRVAAAANVLEDGTLTGNLYVIGGGDPALTDATLRTLVDDVRAAGVRYVEGGVVGDESRFDRRRGGPRTGFRPDRDIGGRLGALLQNRGFQASPAAYVARRLRSLLRESGVVVVGAARAGRPPSGELVELGTAGGLSMAQLARLTNVPSDNFLAEMLLKNLGAEFGGAGSTSAGARVVRRTLGGFGVRPRIADGSGLSRANRTTPRQVVQLLEEMEERPVARVWRASLAVTGRSGTVRLRMRGSAASGRCRVKTGTIIGVSNLAGVCSTAGGRRVAFAWLMNGVSPYGARAIQDRMTALLARYTG